MRGTGAVDLVGHQQLREDRPLDEAEAALAVLTFLHHLGAENVGGHQIGRELHPQRVEANDDPQRLDQLGLGEARHADQQSVSAGEQRRERQVDDPLLAEYDAADLRARGGDALQRRVGVAGQLAWIGDIGHVHRLVLCAMRTGLRFRFVVKRTRLNARPSGASPKHADVRFAHKQARE